MCYAFKQMHKFQNIMSGKSRIKKNFNWCSHYLL